MFRKCLLFRTGELMTPIIRSCSLPLINIIKDVISRETRAIRLPRIGITTNKNMHFGDFNLCTSTIIVLLSREITSEKYHNLGKK